MLINLDHYQNITQKIDDMVEAHGLDYIDAVISYCENYNIEIETIGEIISKTPVLKSKIELEAQNLHFLKATEKLPI